MDSDNSGMRTSKRWLMRSWMKLSEAKVLPQIQTENDRKTPIDTGWASLLRIAPCGDARDTERFRSKHPWLTNHLSDRRMAQSPILMFQNVWHEVSLLTNSATRINFTCTLTFHAFRKFNYSDNVTTHQRIASYDTSPPAEWDLTYLKTWLLDMSEMTSICWRKQQIELFPFTTSLFLHFADLKNLIN